MTSNQSWRHHRMMMVVFGWRWHLVKSLFFLMGHF